MSATTTSLLRNTDNEVIPQYWDGSAWVPYKRGKEIIVEHEIPYTELVTPSGGNVLFGENYSQYTGSVIPLNTKGYSKVVIEIRNNTDTGVYYQGGSGGLYPPLTVNTLIPAGDTFYTSSDEILQGSEGIMLDFKGIINTEQTPAPTTGTLDITIAGTLI